MDVSNTLLEMFPLFADSLLVLKLVLVILSASLFVQNALGLESFLGYLMCCSCLSYANS